jgi:hemolysin III
LRLHRYNTKVKKQLITEDIFDRTSEKLSKDGSVNVTDERVNTVTSLVGACLSVLGGALLVTQSAAMEDPWKIIAFSIYSLSLLVLFTSSALHHAVTSTETVERRLRTFDYVSVFGLICGTVTPIVLILDRTIFGWAVLGSIYTLAIIGTMLRSFKHDLPRHITNTLYIVLGWLPVALVTGLAHLPLAAIILLVAGGLSYSLGFIVYTTERPNFRSNSIFGFHELWHCMVILAAVTHYVCMYLYVLPR